jgi:hypothetical protein
MKKLLLFTALSLVLTNMVCAQANMSKSEAKEQAKSKMSKSEKEMADKKAAEEKQKTIDAAKAEIAPKATPTKKNLPNKTK